jgi:hypothetical protein
MMDLRGLVFVISQTWIRDSQEVVFVTEPSNLGQS